MTCFLHHPVMGLKFLFEITVYTLAMINEYSNDKWFKTNSTTSSLYYNYNQNYLYMYTTKQNMSK